LRGAKWTTRRGKARGPAPKLWCGARGGCGRGGVETAVRSGDDSGGGGEGIPYGRRSEGSDYSKKPPQLKRVEGPGGHQRWQGRLWCRGVLVRAGIPGGRGRWLNPEELGGWIGRMQSNGTKGLAQIIAGDKPRAGWTIQIEKDHSRTHGIKRRKEITNEQNTTLGSCYDVRRMTETRVRGGELRRNAPDLLAVAPGGMGGVPVKGNWSRRF